MRGSNKIVILENLYFCSIIQGMTKAERFYDAQNKLAAYDQETNNLVDDAKDFTNVITQRFDLPTIVKLLRDSFKKHTTYYHVFEESRLENNADPASGFCMVSSYLIYNMAGGDSVWQIRGTDMHWWLYHKQSQKVFDITHTQFDDKDLPGIYRIGRPVQYLQKGEVFDDVLKEKARELAKCAGLR